MVVNTVWTKCLNQKTLSKRGNRRFYINIKRLKAPSNDLKLWRNRPEPPIYKITLIVTLDKITRYTYIIYIYRQMFLKLLIIEHFVEPNVFLIRILDKLHVWNSWNFQQCLLGEFSIDCWPWLVNTRAHKLLPASFAFFFYFARATYAVASSSTQLSLYNIMANIKR